MKALIVVINILLAGALAWSAGSMFTSQSRPEAKSSGVSVKKTQPKKKPTAGGGKGAVPEMNREEQIAAILSSDMFNPERSPNASGRRGGRVELSLVGTFEAGKIRGAVILQRTNSRQYNPFMRMMWGGGGPGGAPPGGATGGGRRFNFGMNGMNQRRNNSSANTIKQYVRLGETMPNGYTLTALSRTRATLTRGGDKMELELQNPSINQNVSRRGGAPRMNLNQQLQQAQLATQQMMVRALMNMRSGGGENNRGGNRGGGQNRRR